MADNGNIINVDFGKTAQDALPSVEKVYQIKITLDDLRPPLWRRLQIPSGINFMELHLILQEALGWENAHMFAFQFRHTEVGVQIDDYMDFNEEEALEAEETVIDEMLESEKKCVYKYDFGDGWTHKLILEKVLVAEPGKKYPICVAGRRCCPPEDVGGAWGYSTFLRTISDPSDPEHDTMLEWATGDPNGEFDPEAFDLDEINKRLDAFARCGGVESQKGLSAFEEPSIEQWERLFALAKTIKELKPWEKLWDSDLFAIELPGRQEPAIVEALGRSEERYAIAVYPGWDALVKMFTIRDNSTVNGFMSVMGDQDCLMCNFGNREEVEPWDREIYNRLGLKFRGRNQWVYFRSILPGYAGWRLSREEADLIETALVQFVKAYYAFCSGEITVKFHEGQMFWRAYDPQGKTWRNECREIPVLEMPSTIITVNESEELVRLRNVKQIKNRICLTTLYLPFPMRDKGERPYYPRLLLIADMDNQMIYNQDIVGPGDDFVSALLQILDDFIIAFGRPKSLHVSDQLFALVADYCNKIGIKPKKDDPNFLNTDFIAGLLDVFEFVHGQK